MNIKTLLLLILSFVSLNIYGQDKIAHKIYSYGQVENSIQGKTLVHYLLNDAKGEVKIIDLFKGFDIDAVSWNKYFMPGYTYTNEEVSEVFNKNTIKTLILIKVNNVATTNSGISTTIIQNNTATTYGTSGKSVVSVNLSLEVYNATNNFSKPICVINGEASYGWVNTQRILTNTVIKRMLNAMEDEKAF
jgi:hypothetical protein